MIQSILDKKTAWGKRIASVAIMLVFFLLVYHSVSVHAEALNTFDPDTWSVDFTYNGYFSGWNGSSYDIGKLFWGACTEIGSAITSDVAQTKSGDRLYYNLPESRSDEGYFRFEDSFIYTDPDTLQTKHYDVVVYVWSPTTWSSTSDRGVILACDKSKYEECKLEFSTYAWVNSITTYTNGAQTAKVNTEWHFYETGTNKEASVSGVFYLNDNDMTEGYKVLSTGNGSLYVQEDNVMTVDNEDYVVGTINVTGTEDSDIYALFSTSSDKPFVLGYKTNHRLRSHPVSNGYQVSYSFVGEVPSGVTIPSDFYVSRFINTKQGADALFPQMTAAGYSWDGWYTDSSLTGSKYTGTTATHSSVTVYSGFTKLYGNLTVTKAIDTGQLDVEKDLSGFAFHLYGTSDAGDEIDLYAVTDDQGCASYANVPVCTSGACQLEEVSASDVRTAASNGNASAAAVAASAAQELTEYVTDYTTLLVTISANDTNQVTWTNYVKQWRISITKLDSSIKKTGQAATGASLKGAVYGLYRLTGSAGTGELIAAYTTDAKGQFTTDYQACGDGWYLQEISPSPGYELDDTIYYIDASADLFETQYNAAHLAAGSYVQGYEDCVFEEAVLGKLTVIKYGTDGNALPGVTFELQDKSGKVLKEAVTDQNGKVVFKDLAAGEYVICETETADGYTLLAEPISVSLPYTMTVEEVKSAGADTSNAIWNEEESVWMFYELTWRITDSAGYTLPMTGEDGFPYSTAAAGVSLLLFGSFLWTLYRRRMGQHTCNKL